MTSLSKFKNFMATLVATFFYLGHCPFMPGTVTSLVAAVIFFFLPPLSWPMILFLLSILFLSGVCVSGFVERSLQIKDPSCIVIDEVLGMSVALCMLPNVWWIYLVAFVLFRILDISKAYPINLVEKYLPGGYGVMLDDLVAGLEAGVITLSLLRLIV